MTDPRRPVYRPDHDTQAVIRQMVNHFLTEATSVGCKAIGCTGAAFVTTAITLWTEEMAEVDARNTARFYRALADLCDPDVSDAVRKQAARRRHKAIDGMYASLDMLMATPEGQA